MVISLEHKMAIPVSLCDITFMFLKVSVLITNNMVIVACYFVMKKEKKIIYLILTQ